MKEGCVVVVADFAMGAFNIKPLGDKRTSKKERGEKGRASE